MQVILIQNVPRVGRKFDIVEVSNGYAHNFLFPRKLAEPATKGKIALLEKQKESHKEKEAAELHALKNALETISVTPLVIHVRSDEQGNLYKKIHTADIAKALHELETPIMLTETAIILDTPIDTVGEFTIPIEHGEVKTTIPVHLKRAVV